MIRFFGTQRVLLSWTFNRWPLVRNTFEVKQINSFAKILYSSSSTVAKQSLKNAANLTPISISADIERIGIRRYIDLHRMSCLILSDHEKLVSFEAIWDELKRSNPDMKLVNKFLFTKLDCDVPLDFDSTVTDLKTMGLSPDVRTYGVFINHSCSSGDMDQTNVYLQAMQAADLVPDAYIFSRVLYGYAKAGCPEEVASTKEIIAQLGLWPSRIAYEGLLQAYAEMGDRLRLVNLLNEAWDVLGKSQRIMDKVGSSDLPFTSEFLIKIYVKQLLAETDLHNTFPELLSRLPSPLDMVGRSRARESIKRLLFHGRLQGALDLFRRVDPDTSDDAYLTSLARYILARDPSDESTLPQIWNLADISGSRLSMLRHKAEKVPRKPNQLAPDSDVNFSRLPDAAAVFKTVSEISNRRSTNRLVYNHVAPRLLQLGLSFDDIVQQIEPEAFRSSAAFGCVLDTLSKPSPGAGNEKLTEFVQCMSGKGVLPYTGFVNLRTGVRQALISSTVQQLPATNAYEALVGRLLHTVNTLEQVLDRAHTRTICHQLLEWASSLSPKQPVAGVTAVDGRPTAEAVINALLEVYNQKDIKYPKSSWIFYALENFGIAQERLDSIGFEFSKRAKSDESVEARPGSTFQQRSLPVRLRGLLREGKVEDAISLIGQQRRSSDEATYVDLDKRAKLFEFRSAVSPFTPDAVAIACDLMRPRQQVESSEGGDGVVVHLTPDQLESLFWASWDAMQLTNVPRAIDQVASCYARSGDMKGMSGFYQRASGRLMGYHETLINPSLIQPLLSDNLKENLTTVQSIIGRHLPSLAKFAQATCHVEQVLHRLCTSSSFMNKLSKEDKRLLDHWINPQSTDHWPLQALSERLEGFSHLHRLRIIHLAIDDLCKSNSLQTGHSLRHWASQLGLLLLPKTLELLVLTPQIGPGRDRPSPDLPSWAMCHELSQHWPVHLTAQQLKSLDSLVRGSTVTQVVEATANWLSKQLAGSTAVTGSPSSQHSLPTWLVVSQRLVQTDSRFAADPGTWRALVSRWLAEAGGGKSDAWLAGQLADWLPYAPGVEYRNAILLASLSVGVGQPRVRDWAINCVKETQDYLYGILTCPEIACLPPELYANYVDVMTELGHKDTLELARLFGAETLDVPKVKETVNVITANDDGSHDWTRVLANLAVAKSQLFEPMADYLKEHHAYSLAPFYNHMFDVLSTKNRRILSVSSCRDTMFEQGLNLESLSPQNRAFLYATSRTYHQQVTELEHPLDQFQKLHDGQLESSWTQDVKLALRRQDFVTVLGLLQSLDATLAAEALRLVIYSMVSVWGTNRLGKLLLVIAENTNDEWLLGMACSYARPFVYTGLVDAYAAVADHYAGKEISWIARSTARYYRLGACLRPKAANPGVQRSADANRRQSGGLQQTGEARVILNALIRQPMSGLADALIETQSDPEKFTVELSKITPDWGFQRRNLLLSHLANKGAISVLDQIISQSPDSQKGKQSIFKICAEIIRDGHNGEATESNPKQAVSNFLASSIDQVALCLRRPLAETLFRRWPTDSLADLIPVVRKTALADRSSINLQLAAILVNRGRSDLAKELTKVTGSIPITFLAGSPWYILSPDEVQRTVAYLQDTEPQHVQLFADNCTRNAVSSATATNTESPSSSSSTERRLVDLIRAITQPPVELSLASVCLLPTLNLISEYLNTSGNRGELPSDVESLLRAASSRASSVEGSALKSSSRQSSTVKAKKRSAN